MAHRSHQDAEQILTGERGEHLGWTTGGQHQAVVSQRNSIHASDGTSLLGGLL